MDLKQVYSDLKAAIDAMDEQLDSLTDTKSAGKRVITNQLIEKNKDSWESVVDQFSASLSEAPDEVAIGVYFGIVRGLASKLQDKVNAALDALVASMPEAKPLIDESDAKEIGENRSKVFAQIKSVIALSEQFGEADGMELPKRRTGGRGKRGKRALSYFTWFIGEKEYAKLADVIEVYPQFDKVGTLTAAMRDAGLNLTNPEGDLEFTLPDGELLVGVNGATDEEGEEEETPSEEE